MKKRILTINECYSDNIGDRAISLSLNNILNELGYNAITNVDYTRTKAATPSSKVSTKNKNSFLSNYLILLLSFLGVKKILITAKWFISNFRRIKKSCNSDFSSSVIGGGQLILDNENFPISFYLWCYFLSKRNIKIHVFGVGVGDKFGFLSSALFKSALKKCSSVTVRDKRSQKNLKENFSIDAQLGFDVAYNYDFNTKVDIKSTNEKAVVGITDFEVYNLYKNEASNPELTIDEYFSLWHKLITSEGFSSICLMATTNKDLILTKNFYKYLRSRQLDFEVEFVDELLSVKEYFKKLTEADTVLSGRMHSLILGEVAGCNIRTFEISNKLKSYEEQRSVSGSIQDRRQKTLGLMKKNLI